MGLFSDLYKGLKAYTTAERTGLTLGPTDTKVVFDTDLDAIATWNGTDWDIIPSSDANEFQVVRADAIEAVLPTAVEAVDPNAGDTATVFLTNGTKEYYLYDGTVWTLQHTDRRVPAIATEQSADFTAMSGMMYPVNVTGGTVTITMPAAPVAGDTVTAFDSRTVVTGTNRIVFGTSTSAVQSMVEDYEVDITMGGATLVYIDATIGWAIQR